MTKREYRLAMRDVKVADWQPKPKAPRKQQRGGDGFTKRERAGLKAGSVFLSPTPDGRLDITEFPKGTPFRRSSPRVGPVRNMPCYCGSGRKVKHCHGRDA